MSCSNHVWSDIGTVLTVADVAVTARVVTEDPRNGRDL